MTVNKTPIQELNQRMLRFTANMDKRHEDWEICALTGATNLFYFTGTICDGVLLIRRSGGAVLWARRSWERCLLESEFPDIRPMAGFRDVAKAMDSLPDTLYLDTAQTTMEWHGMFTKYVPFTRTLSADAAVMKTRSVKSDYEVSLLRKAGATVNRLLSSELPALMRDGISEADLGAELLALFIKNGHHGISRFSMRNTNELLGHLCFGTNALYPSVFNGASGIVGLCPALVALGSPARHLRAGDLIFADCCFGVEGYNVDKTLIFSYKGSQPDYIMEAQAHCVYIQRKAASLLRPGNTPASVYGEIISSVLPGYKDRFMGIPGRTVPFIGHSVGLFVDESPPIADGFTEPFENNMVFAIEPKMGFEGLGMVGGENTYLVTDSGGESLTGKASPIIEVN